MRRVATPYPLSGGGGHHGGHHGGGGRIPPFVYGGGYPWWGGPSEVFLVDDGPTQVAACPPAKVPVLASDGLVYDNACLARAAGVKVVRQVAAAPGKALGAWSATIQSDGAMDADAKKAFWGGVIAGVLGGALARAILR